MRKMFRVAAGLVVFALLAATVPVHAQSARTSRNIAPTISGTPPAVVTPGIAYDFTPTAADANSDRLYFFAQNRPAWLSFDRATGRLSASPTATQALAQDAVYADLRVYVSDLRSASALPSFSISVGTKTTTPAPVPATPPPVTSNAAPSISGTPATGVIAGKPYSFVPAASDPEKAPLTFSVQNKPAWAMVNTSTGALTGTPSMAQLGSYANVTISVSDGANSVALPAFSILVTATAFGATTLHWTIPTQNTDGSSVSGLAGYRVYYGSSSAVLNQTLQIANPDTTTAVVPDLTPGTWYFAMTAYTSSGAESARSNLSSKMVN